MDLSIRETFADGFPYDHFALLRREDPVHLCPTDKGDLYCITHYQDIRYVSSHPELFSSERGGTMISDSNPDELQQQATMMIGMDPPHHRAYRRLVSSSFTPAAVAKMEPHIREEARAVVDAIASRGEIDFIHDFSEILPSRLICEFLGVPEEDRELVCELSHQLVGAAEDFTQAGNSAIQMWEYAHQLAERIRTTPDDTLMSKYVHGMIDGERLDALRLNNFFVLLSVAGNETTSTATAHGLDLLSRFPAEREKLLRNLDELLPRAIEEFLRYAPPVLSFRRTTTRDVEVGGTIIPAGCKVVMWYPSGNRDETVFVDPNRFDITRHPNPHLSFGWGEHFCLGVHFARMQLKCIFSELLRRLPDIEVTRKPDYRPGVLINGIREMPVQFKPRIAA